MYNTLIIHVESKITDAVEPDLPFSFGQDEKRRPYIDISLAQSHDERFRQRQFLTCQIRETPRGFVRFESTAKAARH